MDAMDILGGLLGGGKSGGGSLGGKILKEMLGGGRRKTSPSNQSSGRTAGVGSRSGSRGRDLESQARELEDLLGVAAGRTSSPAAPPRQTRYRPPNFSEVGNRYQAPPQRRTEPRSSAPRHQHVPMQSNDEALILVQAMINAAKSDGRITDDEQQAILARVADRSASTIAYLREQFACKLDVREFAWSVPLGLETQVYMLSLAAIDLDTNPEASYLRDLAHGLRLTPQECNSIHQQLGAPALH